MKPIKFKNHSRVLEKPKSMTDEQCESLPILQLNDTNISCWAAGWRERLRILLTGKVWLGVLSGASQPPVYLSASQPFSDEEAVHVNLVAARKQEFVSFMVNKYGVAANRKARDLDLAGIKCDDLRRTFIVDEDDLAEAKRFGMAYMMGLKMVS